MACVQIGTRPDPLLLRSGLVVGWSGLGQVWVSEHWPKVGLGLGVVTSTRPALLVFIYITQQTISHLLFKKKKEDIYIYITLTALVVQWQASSGHIQIYLTWVVPPWDGPTARCAGALPTCPIHILSCIFEGTRISFQLGWYSPLGVYHMSIGMAMGQGWTGLDPTHS